MGHPRVRFACVAEPTDRWVAMVENLVLSIRAFGGSLRDASVVAHFVDRQPSDTRRLEALDAEVRVVERFPLFSEVRSTNKLRMFELEDDADFDVLIALDCDVIVKGDIAPEVRDSVVRAAPDNRHSYGAEEWALIYAGLGLRQPAERTVAVRTGDLGFPFYNGGVLFVPRQFCQGLRERWPSYITTIRELNRDNDGRLNARAHNDQPALACMLAGDEFPFERLPLRMNFPVPVAWPVGAYDSEWGPPWILHYHDKIDGRGFLTSAIQPQVNRELDAFNRTRARHFGIDYQGLTLQRRSKRLDSLAATLPGYRVGRRGWIRARRATSRLLAR